MLRQPVSSPSEELKTVKADRTPSKTQKSNYPIRLRRGESLFTPRLCRFSIKVGRCISKAGLKQNEETTFRHRRQGILTIVGAMPPAGIEARPATECGIALSTPWRHPSSSAARGGKQLTLLERFSARAEVRRELHFVLEVVVVVAADDTKIFFRQNVRVQGKNRTYSKSGVENGGSR